MIVAWQAEPWIQTLIRDARAAGALESEVFFKSGRGRRVMLEPALHPESGPRLTVSTTAEEGVALRLRDREGRWGFAWGTRFSRRAAMDLVEAALNSARRFQDRGQVARPGAIPMARSVRKAGEAARDESPQERGRGESLPDPDIGILDPLVLSEPAEEVADMLVTAGEAAASLAAGSADVDRALLSEAVATVILANSHGLFGTYQKSLALLSVAMVPAAPGAIAALEERSACRLADLEPRECGIEAARRALPPRPAIAPPPGAHPLLLEPRAAASFLSSLVPSILWGRFTDSGRNGERSPLGRLTIIDDGRRPGGVGAAPFDGAGHPTGPRTLVESGRVVGRLSESGGNVVRHSFRDLPALGPSNLFIAPDMDGIPLPPAGLHLRAASAQFVPGRSWRVRILKGEWHLGDAPLGAADGIVWEGPLEKLLAGLHEVGADLRFYHLGLPLGAPSLRVLGLSPWVVEGAGPRASARSPGVDRAPDVARVSSGTDPGHG